MLGGLYTPLGWLYSTAALALGIWWGAAAWQLFKSPQTTAQNSAAARLTFRRSLYYLAWLFATMVLDSFL
jgi:heme O synthase-like polyprenyltransferase